MSKQTAVNWLRNESIKLVAQAMQGTLNEDTLEYQISQIVTKALQMEREQNIEFAKNVFANRYNQVFESLDSVANETYNETYGGQDE
jgi:hypothetical protein